MSTKWNVYKAVVLSILLYGAETWTIKATDLRPLTTFHNRCVQAILGTNCGENVLQLEICLKHLVCSGWLLIYYREMSPLVRSSWLYE